MAWARGPEGQGRGAWASPDEIFWYRQQGLLQVLKAYTLYRPEQGYCQAQGPVAAVLLMHLPPEVSDFDPARRSSVPVHLCSQGPELLDHQRSTPGIQTSGTVVPYF